MVVSARLVLLGLSGNCALTPAMTLGRMAASKLPEKGVGPLEKSSDLPTGTPGMPGMGLGIEEPPRVR